MSAPGTGMPDLRRHVADFNNLQLRGPVASFALAPFAAALDFELQVPCSDFTEVRTDPEPCFPLSLVFAESGK